MLAVLGLISRRLAAYCGEQRGETSPSLNSTALKLKDDNSWSPIFNSCVRLSAFSCFLLFLLFLIINLLVKARVGSVSNNRTFQVTLLKHISFNVLYKIFCSFLDPILLFFSS